MMAPLIAEAPQPWPFVFLEGFLAIAFFASMFLKLKNEKKTEPLPEV
jgi:hypothetical protein